MPSPVTPTQDRIGTLISSRSSSQPLQINSIETRDFQSKSEPASLERNSAKRPRPHPAESPLEGPTEYTQARKKRRIGVEESQKDTKVSRPVPSTLSAFRGSKSSPAVPQSSTLSSSEAAAVMLDRPEDTGGTRTVKLARGSLSSPRRPVVRPASRHSSEQNASFSQSALDAKRSEGEEQKC